MSYVLCFVYCYMNQGRMINMHVILLNLYMHHTQPRSLQSCIYIVGLDSVWQNIWCVTLTSVVSTTCHVATSVTCHLLWCDSKIIYMCQRWIVWCTFDSMYTLWWTRLYSFFPQYIFPRWCNFAHIHRYLKLYLFSLSALRTLHRNTYVSQTLLRTLGNTPGLPLSLHEAFQPACWILIIRQN